MIQTSSKSLTLQEFLLLPETKPVKEYINGKILEKSMLKGKHSTIQTELSTNRRRIICMVIGIINYFSFIDFIQSSLKIA